MNDQNPPPAEAGSRFSFLPSPQDSEIKFRELFDIVWSGRWIVVFVALVTTLAGMAYAFIAQPVYQADGLVQVEKEQSSISASMDQLSSLIGATPAEAPAEIALLKSRMVLTTVADRLNLYVDIEPLYFPIVGKALARSKSSLHGFAPDFAGLGRYAWGGERIRVTALQTPESWYNRPLQLIAGKDDFELHDAAGALLLKGRVGERAEMTTAGGNLSIFVQDLQARPGTEFTLRRLSTQEVLNKLAAELTVAEQPRDSGVLALWVRADEPQFAALLVNEIQEAYLRQNIDRRSAQAAQSLDFLKQQLPDLKAKGDEAQARLNSYRLRKGSVDVQRETDLVLTQSVQLETERLKLLQERDASMQRFTREHPVVMTLNEQIRGLEREQDNIKKQVESLPETQQEILSLMRDLEVNQQLYTALLNSAQELQVTKAGTVGNVRIVDRGLVPEMAIQPRKKVIVGASLMLGILMGVVVIFIMRMLLRGVDRPEDIERTIGIPTYASIPYSANQRRLTTSGRVTDLAALGSVPLLAAVDPADLAIESLRSLRTSLHFAMLESGNNIVMFTGPTAALGKSFVAINFAAVLAMSDKRVVIIDADLRRGHLQRYAGIAHSAGLSDYIAGTADPLSIINKTVVPGLHLIPSGTRPPNPAEVLMNERFVELLKLLSGSYDFVLIDTPPVLPVTDAAIVGRLAGTTLIVLKSAEHPMRAIEETVKRLGQAGVAVRGMIFNQVGGRIGSYGYGEYGEAYGYSSYGYKSSSKAA